MCRSSIYILCGIILYISSMLEIIFLCHLSTAFVYSIVAVTKNYIIKYVYFNSLGFIILVKKVSPTPVFWNMGFIFEYVIWQEFNFIFFLTSNCKYHWISKPPFPTSRSSNFVACIPTFYAFWNLYLDFLYCFSDFFSLIELYIYLSSSVRSLLPNSVDCLLSLPFSIAAFAYIFSSIYSSIWTLRYLRYNTFENPCLKSSVIVLNWCDNFRTPAFLVISWL